MIKTLYTDIFSSTFSRSRAKGPRIEDVVKNTLGVLGFLSNKRPPRKKPSPEALVDLIMWHLKHAEPERVRPAKAKQAPETPKNLAGYLNEGAPVIH